MGINALDEGQNEWFNASGKNPWQPLLNLINTAGYYEPTWAPGTVDWFATKHAVPALLGKSWPIILPARQEETNIANNNTGSVSNYVYLPPLPETPTSTDAINRVSTTTSTCTDALQCVSTPATTTIDIATTTTEILTQITEPTTTIIITNFPASPADGQLPISKQIPNSNKQDSKQITNNNFPPKAVQPMAETISSAPTSTESNPTAKTVFGISLTMASGLGLYLAWRLIQIVV